MLMGKKISSDQNSYAGLLGSEAIFAAIHQAKSQKKGGLSSFCTIIHDTEDAEVDAEDDDGT